jgi:hypothetical protein
MKLFKNKSKGINNSIRHQGISESFTYITLVYGIFDFRPPVSLKTPLLMPSMVSSTISIILEFEDILSSFISR